MTSFRKCHILQPQNSSPKRDSNPRNCTGGRLESRRAYCYTMCLLLLLLLLRRRRRLFQPPRWPSGRASTPRATGTGSNPAFPVWFCPGDLNIGSVVATLTGVWLYRICAGTGWSCVRYCDQEKWQVWPAGSSSV